MRSRSSQDLVKDILSSHAAVLILERAQKVLSHEQEKRQQFHDHLTEFEKAEFINGEIIVHSPVKKEHNDASGLIFLLVKTFVNKNDLGYVGYEKVMVRLTRNDYEPDICFFGKEKSAAFREGQSLFPAPDLVVEVLSPKTAAYDRGVKFEDYRDHGVLEYWLVEPAARWVEQYRLDANGQYDLVLKSGEAHLSCAAIPGFTVRIEAFFDQKINLLEMARLLGA